MLEKVAVVAIEEAGEKALRGLCDGLEQVQGVLERRVMAEAIDVVELIHTIYETWGLHDDEGH